MANIANLSIQLSANTRPFKKGMQDASITVRAFHSTVGAVNNKLAALASGAGAALAGYFAVDRLASWVKESGKAMTATAGLADRLGTTTEAMQAFRVAAGGEDKFESLTSGLDLLNRKIGEAQAGSKTAEADFNALGLTAQGMGSIDVATAFGDVADRIASMGSASERAAAATTIFGKAGTQLLPILTKGSKGIDEAAEKAERLGISFSRVDAQMVKNAFDAFEDFGMIVDGVGQKIAVFLAPYVDVLGQKLVAMATDGNMLGNRLLDAFEGATTALSYFGDAWQVVSMGVNVFKVLAFNTIAAYIDTIGIATEKTQQFWAWVTGKKFKGSPFADGMKAASDSLREDARIAGEKFQETWKSPWKHTQVKQWFDDIRNRARATAAEQVRGNEDVSDSFDLVLGKMEKLSDFQQVDLAFTAVGDVTSRAAIAAASSNTVGQQRLGELSQVEDPKGLQAAQTSNKLLEQINLNTRRPLATAS